MKCITQPPAMNSQTTTPLENTFETRDGLSLFYRAWTAQAATKRAIILLHRGHEHSGRLIELANALQDGKQGQAIFAWDARSHGRSPGVRGDVDHFGLFARDLEDFVRHLRAKHGLREEDIAVVGHSVGAVMLANWVHDYAPNIRAMVLAAPAFDVNLFVPGASLGLRMLNRVRPQAAIKSYVKPKMLTSDPEQAAAMVGDPLSSPRISVRTLVDMERTAKRLIEDASAIHTPTLLLTAGRDYVVRPKAQRAFFDGLSSTRKEHVVLDGQRHGLLHDTERADTFKRIGAFVDAAFDADDTAPDHLHAHEHGAQFDEAAELAKPLPTLSPKRLNFAAQRLGLASAGRLSRGVQIGWEHGFDAGVALDHVYENKAAGTTPLGRLIDRNYLNAIGWCGIRQRGQHLQSRIAAAIDQIAAERPGPIRILDIAAGGGRYVLDTVAAHPLKDRIEVELRDFKPANLEKSQENAAARELKIVTRQHDAFDPASYTNDTDRFNIVIVSGLFELFSDNDLILSALAGLRSSVRDGGHLFYTNQPWHPQLEMIARVLPNHRGGAWVMRRRTQSEMDALVRHAGFDKTAMDIDRWGIFTVSSAAPSP